MDIDTPPPPTGKPTSPAATPFVFFLFFLNQYAQAAYAMARPMGPVRGPQDARMGILSE